MSSGCVLVGRGEKDGESHDQVAVLFFRPTVITAAVCSLYVICVVWFVGRLDLYAALCCESTFVCCACSCAVLRTRAMISSSLRCERSLVSLCWMRCAEQ